MGITKAGRKTEADIPELDPPTGLRCPKRLLGERLGVVRSYCGPWAVMAITGRPYEEVKASFNHVRSRSTGVAVLGTYESEVRRVLRSYGWETEHVPKASLKAWDAANPRKPISFAAALRGRSPEQTKQTWLVAAGNHWMLVHGRKVTCSMLRKWTWTRHAHKRRGHVAVLLRVWRKTDDRTKAVVAETKARNKKLVTAHERARLDAVASSVSRAKDRRLALAEFARLGCTHEVRDWKGEDFEVKVWAPDGMAFDPDGDGRFYRSWQEAWEDLRGKSAEDLFRAAEEE